MSTLDKASTGIKGLDQILQNLQIGDNVVWQVDSLEDYLHYVKPFLEQARQEGKKIVYIRFASHPPLIESENNIKTYQLDAKVGFESFAKQIHNIVTEEGEGVYYVFDCLSDLLFFWATDLMIGNFFMVTCPYLFKLKTVTYFSILRNKHSFKTIARIRETTQLLIDVYDIEDKYYVHPLKVWNRYSPTMFLPHAEEAAGYIPIISSVDASKLFSYMSDKGKESAQRNLDYWDRLFLQAEKMVEEKAQKEEKQKILDQLSRVVIGREQRMLALAEDNFSLEDMLAIKARMIGTGFIGGKAVGMLLARKILQNDKTFDWQAKLEPHDSFYIGSDVFYSYIVENGWWELWLEQKSEGGYSPRAAELKEKMQKGNFPEEIKEQFHQLIEYFGQSPIIIRSSSLLEDSFGNAFAGKYESIFNVNQGTPEKRYAAFEDTVRRVFASTMNEDALTYRLQRGMSQREEQMALLVQRVSGTQHKHYFFPFLAGVGVSYNTFIWQKEMDPKAGMLRLVFGLGTRAVNRVEGDYPRIIALDKPLLQPYAGMDDAREFSQHEVDLLDVDQNILHTVAFGDLLVREREIDPALVAKRDSAAEQKMKAMKLEGSSWVLTFSKLLSETEFPGVMQKMLAYLENVYRYPVDIEFTVNYDKEGKIRINLLQCRPLQAKGPGGKVDLPEKITRNKLLFDITGNFMGGNVSQPLQMIVYIDPVEYGKLLHSKKYDVARLVGKLNRKIGDRLKMPVMLMGPGRWGTRDATLGVPVSFAEINNFSVLVEMTDPAGNFMPELSFGSHFFLDLVEAQIFYIALFLENKNVFLDKNWLAKRVNQLEELLPEEGALARVVKVCDFSSKPLQLLSDISSQRAICLK